MFDKPHLRCPNQVVADTSMLTMSTEYAAHFHCIFIDGKEHAKMTGDLMKMLMLALPHMVRDLIAPEVSRTDWYVLVHNNTYMYVQYYLCMYMYIPVCTGTCMNILHFNGYSRQVELTNAAVDKPKKVLICMVYHMWQIQVRRFKRFS